MNPPGIPEVATLDGIHEVMVWLPGEYRPKLLEIRVNSLGNNEVSQTVAEEKARLLEMTGEDPIKYIMAIKNKLFNVKDEAKVIYMDEIKNVDYYRDHLCGGDIIFLPKTSVAVPAS